MRILLAGLIVLIGPLTARAQNGGADVLSTLRPGHPRLLVLEEDLARVKQSIASDATAKQWFEQLKKAADKLIDEPVSQRVLIGPRLLHVSREVLRRTVTLAGIYRLTGEKKYAVRAREEMLAAANFIDWHPAHFLDTAEMTNGLAIGYDWLFDFLSPDERAILRNAIVEKGLKPGLRVYASGKGFAVNTNNWNQVCNGGLTVGALAIADEEPEVAREVIAKARASLPRAMALFNPDGGCEEGPGYWAYATEYTVFYLAALKTALGTDFGFLQTPGLAETGLFRIHSIGPAGKTFNYADAGEEVRPTPQMFWFAGAFDQPRYAADEMMRIADAKSPSMLHLLWYEPLRVRLGALPKAAMFKRINVAFFRSGWDDRDAAFVGFKGGNNTFSHGHLDLGSFVYDADGVRWARDLGPDDYNLPGYFGRERWNYYRLRTEGQNTITLDGENQKPTAKAPIVAFSPEGQYAVADLSDGYPTTKRATRGVRLIGRQLLVQDEVQSDEPVDFVWHMHTPAKIDIDSSMRKAVLAQGTKEAVAQILSPPEAHFAVAAADPPPPVQPDPPMRKLTRDSQKLIVRLPQKVSDLRLIVLLAPHDEGVAHVSIEPLQNWIDAAPTTRPSRIPATRP